MPISKVKNDKGVWVCLCCESSKNRKNDDLKDIIKRKPDAFDRKIKAAIRLLEFNGYTVTKAIK